MTAAVHKVKAEFVRQLREAMKAQGVSSAELARRIGRDPAQVTNTLKPNTNITTLTMVRMAAALGLEVHFSITPAP